jgi:hypothetical protein
MDIGLLMDGRERCNRSKRIRQKCEAALRPALRENKAIERSRVSRKNGIAPADKNTARF